MRSTKLKNSLDTISNLIIIREKLMLQLIPYLAFPRKAHQDFLLIVNLTNKSKYYRVRYIVPQNSLIFALPDSYLWDTLIMSILVLKQNLKKIAK